VDWLESRFKLRLPVDYKAFLLNYNGGEPKPGYFRHDLVTQRFGITLPAGYHGQCPDWDDKTNDPGPVYGQVSFFSTIWAAADSAPNNAQACGDWSSDLVNNLQLLEHFRTGVADWPAPYWREGVRRNLIWIGVSAPNGMHEVWCLGVHGKQAGRVYHVASNSGHACECDECLLIAPSLAAFLSLFAVPSERHHFQRRR
jgi:SMI1 / KNR4 family (SUKH-1)